MNENSEDEILTRKAIEEILRDSKNHKEQDEICANQERKVNPVRKTNKQFLGRTLNAVVRHNERADERTRKKCRKKLKELDRARYRNRSESPDHSKIRKQRKDKIYRARSNDSSESKQNHKLKSKHKKKHKQRKKRRRRVSSSSRSSLSSIASSTKRKKYLKIEDNPLSSHQNHGACNQEIACPPTDVEMQNYAAWMVHPLMQLYHLETLMNLGANAQPRTESVQIDEISISSSSLSDVNFDEVDEPKDGSNVMLTINVSTEDDDESSDESIKTKSSKTNKPVESNCIEIIETDTESDASRSGSPVIEVTDSDAENTAKPINIEQEQEEKDHHPDNESVISLKSTDSNAAIDSAEDKE